MKLKYHTGSDRRQYAVGGSVKIGLSDAWTPEETFQKAQRIGTAALAPSKPSPQDLQVAAKASQMEVRARAKIIVEKREAIEATDCHQSSICWSVENSNSVV